MPMPLVIGHRPPPVPGIVSLIINVVAPTDNMMMNASLALFCAAALGGFTLFSFHVRKKPMPVVLIPVHGAVAVIAFIVLVLAVFR